MGEEQGLGRNETSPGWMGPSSLDDGQQHSGDEQCSEVVCSRNSKCLSCYKNKILLLTLKKWCNSYKVTWTNKKHVCVSVL